MAAAARFPGSLAEFTFNLTRDYVYRHRVDEESNQLLRIQGYDATSTGVPVPIPAHTIAVDTAKCEPNWLYDCPLSWVHMPAPIQLLRICDKGASSNGRKTTRSSGHHE